MASVLITGWNGIAAILEENPIDFLIDNAGIEAAGSVEELPLARFRALMETNYFGALRCIQALVGATRSWDWISWKYWCGCRKDPCLCGSALRSRCF